MPGAWSSFAAIRIAYFAELMNRYPALTVRYDGNPLMILFTGATPCVSGYSTPCAPLVSDFLAKLTGSGFASQFTFKIMAGYFDAQSPLWNPGTPSPPTAPIQMNPNYPYWSWVDRLAPSPYNYFPTYNVVGGHVENFTVSVATAGADELCDNACPNVLVRASVQ